MCKFLKEKNIINAPNLQHMETVTQGSNDGVENEEEPFSEDKENGTKETEKDDAVSA